MQSTTAVNQLCVGLAGVHFELFFLPKNTAYDMKKKNSTQLFATTLFVKHSPGYTVSVRYSYLHILLVFTISVLTRLLLSWLPYSLNFSPTALPFSHFWNLMLTTPRFTAASWPIRISPDVVIVLLQEGLGIVLFTYKVLQDGRRSDQKIA